MSRKLVYLLLFLSLIAYLITGYKLQRENFGLLILLYSGLFIVYFGLLKSKEQISLPLAIAAGLLFRFVMLFSFPALSDDVYRFLWDGRLQQLGINPFDFTPRQAIAQNPDTFLNLLFPYLNSPDYYSVYPQLLQYIFRVATEIGGTNLLAGVIVLKSFIFLIECGNIYLLNKLLALNKLNPRLISIYLFNPLVIIELTGNIHFEAIMIFFVLLTAWLLQKKQLPQAALALTLAIQAKLLPLIGIPLLVNKLGFSKTILFGIGCILLFWISSPFLWGGTERYLHFFSSLQLYYGKFEFNGSIYTLFRGAGIWLLGYNPIEWVSKIMMVLTIMLFLIIYKSRSGFLQGFFWLMVIYLGFSAVVHPWYLAVLVAIYPFTKYRFALVWTAFVPLTYIAYSETPYQQNYWIIALEYVVVVGWLIYETRLENSREYASVKLFDERILVKLRSESIIKNAGIKR